MSKEEAKKRIEKLKKVINYHRYLYHVKNKQEISTDALDSLKHELYILEKENPEFINPDSPTQRVEGEPLEKFGKAEHETPMLSLEDVFTKEELKDWEEYLKRLVPVNDIDYFCELKIDGFAVSLVYVDGVFSQGSTRGDGKTGEDVTQNLKTIESIPLDIKLQDSFSGFETIKEKIERSIKKGRIEVRGEVYMEKNDFERFNEKRKKRGEPSYANPRNLAAGSIRQLDPKITSKRPLKFLSYSLVTDVGQERHSKEHKILSALGFKADKGRKCGSIEEVIDFWKEVSTKREKFPFQIDGVVVNVNNNSVFRKLGVAGKSPRGARAFKFSPKQATTKILGVRFQVGRTGTVTPVANLEPVNLEGVTVSSATLHNKDQIKKLGIRIGDTVIVERAGDVIPAVVEALPDLRTGKEKGIKFPKKCPVCKSVLKKPKGESLWRCLNSNCYSRKKEFLEHFVSKKAFDIEGLGSEIVDQLIKEGLIQKPYDIFSLKKGDLLPLERFADKSADNLVKAIEDSKKIPFAKFIYSLGIRHVGEETSFSLAQYFGSLKKLKNAGKSELEEIPDIGPEVSESIYNWFRSKENLKLISKLLELGVEIISPKKVASRLKSKKFVLTGSLDSLTRNEAKKKIRLLGGEAISSVSKETDFLILGKNPGSKLKEAENLGVKILSEKDFLDLIK